MRPSARIIFGKAGIKALYDLFEEADVIGFSRAVRLKWSRHLLK